MTYSNVLHSPDKFTKTIHLVILIMQASIKIILSFAASVVINTGLKLWSSSGKKH